jgi:hypothetical protein
MLYAAAAVERAMKIQQVIVRALSGAITSRREGTTASAAPSRSRSGCGGARLAWGGAGALPRVREGEVREDRPDDRGIVQRGDQT